VTANAGSETIDYYNNISPTLGTAQSGTTPATNVTKYVVRVTSGNVTPQNTVTFTFQRKISGNTATP
jgi:hypothetical protein